ncbi:hypothetical protein ES705_46547 [subsurface metagenome]
MYYSVLITSLTARQPDKASIDLSLKSAAVFLSYLVSDHLLNAQRIL